MQENLEKTFTGYEYKEIIVSEAQVSMYLDCYENFGWIVEEPVADRRNEKQILIRMKRDRKIMNKMELTRLQRNFEACVDEIGKLECAKTKIAMVWSLSVGILGTVFMAGSTFAVTHEPPIVWLCILLAVPGIIGWILPYFLYHWIAQKRTKKLQPLIEEKREEIYEVCEKGYSLLYK